MFRRFSPLRRSIAAIVAACIVASVTPRPARAGMSTAQEVQIGKQTDKQVTDTTNVVGDPLLNAWVNGITTRLWAQVARKDVPYNIKILDVSDINAFSTLGGYVYVDLGTLDFVQSDDELAGVLGHETGHIERRHAVTSQSKETLMSILLGVGSLFAPYLAPFGQFLGAGAVAKIERTDENQADRYGLMLMARAGYDPDAMVTFMKHLGAIEHENHEFIDKYLADHPGVHERVARLSGYPELDPTKRTREQREAAALHDLDEARYAIAARDFSALARSDANDTVALYHLGEAQLALGQTNKGEQNLAQAAASGTPQTRTLALGLIHGLRDTERRFIDMHPNLGPVRDAIAAARAHNRAVAASLAAPRNAATDEAKDLSVRISGISNEMPDLSRVRPKHDGQLDHLLRDLDRVGRSLDGAIGKITTTVGGVGSLEPNKSGGAVKTDADVLGAMAAPLALDGPPPMTLATLAFYPRMTAGITRGDDELSSALTTAVTAMSELNAGLGDLDGFTRRLAQVPFISDDIAGSDATTLKDALARATTAISKAESDARRADALYQTARSRALATQIDLLGLASSADRYASLRRALDTRFADTVPTYDAMLHVDASPADVACAAIIAADTTGTPDSVLADARAAHEPVIDVAATRGMDPQALEIMLGLVYLDYTDDPQSEAEGRS